jgi:acetyl esterase/lipase
MRYFIILLLLAFTALQSLAQGSPMMPAATKQTYAYAVKGGNSLYLDHYSAPVEGKRPCVIFVFGGGFVGGSRDNDHDIPYFLFLTQNGYDVVSIDYRLGMKGVQSPGIIEFLRIFDQTINIAVEDLFSATNFILEHAQEWQIDTSKIVVKDSDKIVAQLKRAHMAPGEMEQVILKKADLLNAGFDTITITTEEA